MASGIGASLNSRAIVASEDNSVSAGNGRVDAAEYLRDLAKYLARIAIAPSELVALVFEANGLDVDIRTKRRAHAFSPPPLRDLLGGLGANCAKEGITVSQLRRITFADREVTVEFAAGDGRLQTRGYTMDAVVRAAKPIAASAAILKDGTASR
jgi:hypothetical protein